MKEFNASSVNSEDPKSVERTLGMGKVRIQTFDDLQKATLVSNEIYQFLCIKNTNTNTSIYDPTIGKKEMRPLFLLEPRSVSLEELENEWYSGEFYFLVEPQGNITVIKGL